MNLRQPQPLQTVLVGAKNAVVAIVIAGLEGQGGSESMAQFVAANRIVGGEQATHLRRERVADPPTQHITHPTFAESEPVVGCGIDKSDALLECPLHRLVCRLSIDRREEVTQGRCAQTDLRDLQLSIADSASGYRGVAHSKASAASIAKTRLHSAHFSPAGALGISR